MYGMVNKALQQMVLDNHDEATWDSICSAAGVDVPGFVSMQAYPDELTYALLQSACDILKRNRDELLESFGLYWIRFTEESYSTLFSMSGRTLLDFLRNLDQLHARLGNNIPNLRPPSFRIEDVSPGLTRVHYFSDRQGLEPFVLGLLRGLAASFDEPVEVSLESVDGVHRKFLVRHV